MNYKEIKEVLLANGWTLEYIQTSGGLDLLQFLHPTISGEIQLDFDYSYELPQNIIDGEEFNYLDSEFLNPIPILSVSFIKDMSISYLSDDVIDTYGAENENAIHFYKDDIDKHFHKVFSFMSNPFILLDFQKEYNEKVEKFNSKIKRFLPILQKFGIVSGEFSCGYGNESTLFKKYAFCFKVCGYKYDTVDFWFDLFNEDKHSVSVNIGNEKFNDTLDTDLDAFEKRMIEIMANFEELKVLREKHNQTLFQKN